MDTVLSHEEGLRQQIEKKNGRKLLGASQGWGLLLVFKWRHWLRYLDFRNATVQ